MTHNKPFKLISLIGAIAAIQLATYSTVQATDTIADAIKESTHKLSFRSRYENVDQHGFTEDAKAFTLRTRLTLNSGAFHNTSFTLEFDDVTIIGNEDFTNATNNNATYPTIADVEGTEINQAFLDFNGLPDTTVRYGRQRILLDNQRFVGGVGFRQNEQTYDGFSFTNTTVADLKFFYAYIFNINRITGESVASGDHEHSTHLINLNYSGFEPVAITLYAYLIENEDTASHSTDTFGIRFKGSIGSDDLKLLYTAEAATQEEADNNTTDFDASYGLLEGGIKIPLLSASMGFETLEGNNTTTGQSFRTPLATLHAFQGWADKFLATPDAGIDDTYFKIVSKQYGYKFVLIYHDYSAQDGGSDFGDEINVALSTKFANNYGVKFEYADFSAEDNTSSYVDTEKFWVTLSANF